MTRTAGLARVLCVVGAMVSGLASALLWAVFHVSYWRHRHHFDDEGRYFDATEMVVYHEQSWFIAVPAILCLVVSVALAWRVRRSPTR